MNFYGGSNPPENDKDTEDMETGNDTEVHTKGTKLLVDNSSER